MKDAAATGASEQSSSQAAATPLAFRVVRGGLWVAASSYSTVAFGFLANLVLTRILAPEHFGVFALAFSLFSIVSIRPKIGIGYAFAQRQETTGELLGSHFVLDLSAGFMTLLLAAAVVPLLLTLGLSQGAVWVMLALAGVAVVESVAGTAAVLLDKELHFRQASLVTGLLFPLSYLPAFWLALHGGGYWSLVAQQATYALLLLVGMWWVARRQCRYVWRLRWRFDRRIAGELVQFGMPVGMALFISMLVTQLDNLLIGMFVGEATLGFYDRAYRIAQWPHLLLASVTSRAAFYTYARLQADRARLQKTMTMTSWLITVSGLPLGLAIFASAPDLVALLYGDVWRPSALLLRLLVICSLLRPLLDNASSLFVAVGQPRRATLVVAIQVAVLIAVATPLTLTYGAAGTAVGVGIAFLVGLAVSYRYVSRIVPLALREIFAAPILAAVLALAAYLTLAQSVDLNVLPLAVRVLVKAAFAAGVFLALGFVLQPRITVERAEYVWRLVRRREVSPALNA